MSDPSLTELKKDYYLGNYQSCVNKANLIETTKESTFYLCLSYCHLKRYDNLRLETSKSSNEQCIKIIDNLVSYIQKASQRDAIIKELDQLIESKSIDPKDDLTRLVVSAIYLRHRLFTKSIGVIHKLDSAPARFARIQILIQMNLFDKAEVELGIMSRLDELPFLTQLASAHVNLATYRAREAYKIASELEEDYRPTPLLKNLQTAAAICVDDFETAKQHCENCLDMDNDNPEALINIIHILSKLKASPEIKERNFSRLKSLYPDHEFVKEYERLQTELVQ